MAPLLGGARRSTPAVDRMSISPAAVSVSDRTAVVFTQAAAPAVVCSTCPDVPAVVMCPVDGSTFVTHVGVPPVLSSIWPDVPMARHVGRPTLDATSTAPLVGMLHDGAELAEL